MDYGCDSSKEAFKEVNKKNSCFCVHISVELTVALLFKPNLHNDFFIKKSKLLYFLI